MLNRNLAALAAALALGVFCACSSGQRRDSIDDEEARRASLQMQSIMDMVSSRSIPPVDFETGSAVLDPSSYPLLDKIAQLLLEYPKLKLIVEGHTDDVGGAEHNENLSLKRAGSVKYYLAAKGVYPDFIRVYGFGSKRPISDDKSDRGRALNRKRRIDRDAAFKSVF